MKIIVESGATKSDWRLIGENGEEVRRVLSSGMNVSSMKMDEIKKVISSVLDDSEVDSPDGFYLYTAGVVTDEIRSELKNYVSGLLRRNGHNSFLLSEKSIDIQDDLVGAARASLGDRCGVVAILGTGSNSCYYDGQDVFRKVKSGGYVLGDEGSGATLGRLFLADYLKDLIPAGVASDFEAKFDSSYAGIVENVYRSASPSGYLGSLAPFILEHYDNPYIKDLVDGNFRAFITRSLLRYDSKLVGVTGGFGFACRDIFSRLCGEYGLGISAFVPSPIEGLITYHSRTPDRNI